MLVILHNFAYCIICNYFDQSDRNIYFSMYRIILSSKKLEHLTIGRVCYRCQPESAVSIQPAYKYFLNLFRWRRMWQPAQSCCPCWRTWQWPWRFTRCICCCQSRSLVRMHSCYQWPPHPMPLSTQHRAWAHRRWFDQIQFCLLVAWLAYSLLCLVNFDLWSFRTYFFPILTLN